MLELEIEKLCNHYNLSDDSSYREITNGATQSPCIK
jgi:hypothetical protein